jgi:type II secretory pathway component GspD/PulD (secretin)
MAADTMTNSLVISGPPEAVDEVRALLEKLDVAPGLVLVEMEMGFVQLGETKASENPNPKEKSPATTAEPFQLPKRPERMETTARARVITMSNQPAFIQMGSRVPRLSTIKETGSELRLDNVGLIVGVTPRISGGAVTMQIDVEESQLAPESEGIPISVAGDKVVRSPVMKSTTVQTTVKILDGHPMILGSAARQGKADKELVIIITPHIVGLEEAKNAQ